MTFDGSKLQPLNRSTRRDFLSATALAAIGLPLAFHGGEAFAAAMPEAQPSGTYNPPPSPRKLINFNLDWKFFRDDAEGAESPKFDDSKWADISTPHTFNDVDSFRMIISHGGGDRGTYKGLAWYRKSFVVPQEFAGHNLFIEFEGMRQAGDIYINGKPAGLYENGVTAYGLDITKLVKLGEPNVLAVRVDNRGTYHERATDTGFQWNTNDFNPNFGGINHRVWLHVTGPIYQTLPLYYGLETGGVYVWAENFSFPNMTCDISVEAEVRNGSEDRATPELSAYVVDQNGKLCAHLEGSGVDMVKGEKTTLSAQGSLKEARFWSPEDPYLYSVYTILTVEGAVVDVQKTTTGFRKIDFRGGAGTGGIYINNKSVYLKGFGIRSSDAWAGLGQAYPDWMHDFNAKMMRESNANHVRWMHVAPQKVEADACAKFGIIQSCPAGDKEGDEQGRRWEQRVEVMRNTIVYFRNNPSIMTWEAGNSVISVEHMKEMLALKEQWDAHGGRPMGARDNDNTEANTALTNVAGYFPVMLGQDARIDKLIGGSAMFRGYSADRRDRGPIVETEDLREEASRRYWDEYSPPYYGFKKGPNDTWELDSESFALRGVRRYWEYWSNRITNKDRYSARWSGYASIFFSDLDSDGRQDSSEVARVSGKVDAVRLPKQIYFACRVVQNTRADVHILGHWSYPQGKKTVKTIYVIANTGAVELFLNGKSLGVNSKPESGFIFAYSKVEFAPGTLRAVAKLNGKDVVEQVLTTAGAPAAVRLTPIVGPLGLQADGADIALVNVEVVDANGQRCPTDDGRIDFDFSGAGIWRGGYNSGKTNSTNNLYINTELGINRVAIRATRQAGEIVLRAKRDGLQSASLKLVSQAVSAKDGLCMVMPQQLRSPSQA